MSSAKHDSARVDPVGHKALAVIDTFISFFLNGRQLLVVQVPAFLNGSQHGRVCLDIVELLDCSLVLAVRAHAHHAT